MRPFAERLRCAGVGLLLVPLSGCSAYMTRSDLIAPQGGDAVAGNQVVQMVDPWPRDSADRQIAYDGKVMGAAVERYRAGKVIAPKGAGTSDTYEAQQQTQPNDALSAAAAAGLTPGQPK